MGIRRLGGSSDKSIPHPESLWRLEEFLRFTRGDQQLSRHSGGNDTANSQGRSKCRTALRLDRAGQWLRAGEQGEACTDTHQLLAGRGRGSCLVKAAGGGWLHAKYSHRGVQYTTTAARILEMQIIYLNRVQRPQLPSRQDSSPVLQSLCVRTCVGADTAIA